MRLMHEKRLRFMFAFGTSFVIAKDAGNLCSSIHNFGELLCAVGVESHSPGRLSSRIQMLDICLSLLVT